MAVKILENIVLEIVKDKLYWSPSETLPNLPGRKYIISLDKDLDYKPFCHDFGPLSLGQTYKYCLRLHEILNDNKYNDYKICQITTGSPEQLANSAYLICAFQIINLFKKADDVLVQFSKISLIPFRDANQGECFYDCTLDHCVRALERVVYLKWFEFDKFNVFDYDFREKVENGDMNWIIPNKLLAFSSPSSEKIDSDGNTLFTPEDYGVIFKNLKIKTVVRLNKEKYDGSRFAKFGITHHDLYFPDGSVPSLEIVNKFIYIVENSNGPVAVHCKAGLGRTGTLISCFGIKVYNFPAQEFISWCRIARPGSILGPQQHFLLEYSGQLEPSTFNSYEAVPGQASKLLKAKKSHQKICETRSKIRRGSLSIARARDFKQLCPILSTKYMKKNNKVLKSNLA